MIKIRGGWLFVNKPLKDLMSFVYLKLARRAMLVKELSHVAVVVKFYEAEHYL